MKNADRASVETIRRLNREYIAAYMEADVGWYRRHLARDFVCIESDGSVQTRVKFLAGAFPGAGRRSVPARERPRALLRRRRRRARSGDGNGSRGRTAAAA